MPDPTDPQNQPNPEEPELDPTLTPGEEPEEPETPVDPETPEEEPEEEPEEAPTPPSRREQLRVQELLAKMKEEPQAPQRKSPTGINYEDMLEADPEVIKQLNEDRTKASDAAYNEGLEQSKSIQFHTRLEIDAPRIEAKYTQLDKESQDFHPVLANAINTMYLSAVGYDAETGKVQNPNIRYGTYVESIFELADEIATQKNQESAKNITKQAATTGLRPDGSGAKRLNLNKDPSQMTDEELDAVIAQSIPKR